MFLVVLSFATSSAIEKYLLCHCICYLYMKCYAIVLCYNIKDKNHVSFNLFLIVDSDHYIND